MICPQTFHTSSQGASNKSHQQLGGVEGSEIPKWRTARRIAALTMVGTAYSAYAGVCSLGRVLASFPKLKRTQSNHARVIQVTPRFGTRVLVIHEAEHAEVINERAIGQHDVDVEPKAFEDLHFGDDDGVFEVIERVAEIRHGCVFELVRVLACEGRGERVRGALEEEVIDVDEVSDPERALFEFRGEIECAHAYVLGVL